MQRKSEQLESLIEAAARTVANSVEEEAWEHLSLKDEETALETLRNLVRKASEIARA